MPDDRSLNRFLLEYRRCGWRAFRLRRRWPVSDERSPLRSDAQAQARLTADQSDALRSVLRVFCGGDPIAVANAAVRLTDSLLPAAPWLRRNAWPIRSAPRPLLYMVSSRDPVASLDYSPHPVEMHPHPPLSTLH